MNPANLPALVGVAVTPIVLISATAILLSGFNARQSNVATQMRSLTVEFRATTNEARRQNLRRQLQLFERRVLAMWVAGAALCVALFCFLLTIFALLFASRGELFDKIGEATLLAGLTLILFAVLFELHEVWLSRRTTLIELEDILPRGEDT